MESIIFTCNDVSITVNSDHSEIINYLNNMFGNYYNDISKDIDYEINFFIGMPTSTTYIDHEKGDPTENYIDGSTEELNIYIPYFDKTKESFVKRIFTTTTVKVFEKKGYTILHGACAIKDNKGVIITGEAGSGKTTLLTKLLKNGYGYIANDRLAIKRDNDNIVVCGIPYSMGINEKDIAKSFNEFDSYSINEINKKFLENKEVPKYFCTYMKSHIELGTIVCGITALLGYLHILHGSFEVRLLVHLMQQFGVGFEINTFDADVPILRLGIIGLAFSFLLCIVCSRSFRRHTGIEP